MHKVFLCLRVITGRIVLDFSVLWPSLLAHGRLHWWRKFLTWWCSQEVIQMCLKYVLLLCCKCILYNTVSDQIPVLCNRRVPCDGPMCNFCWVFHELWPCCLVVTKVFCWSQNFPPSLRVLKPFSCILKAWLCSTLCVLALVFCLMGAL